MLFQMKSGLTINKMGKAKKKETLSSTIKDPELKKAVEGLEKDLEAKDTLVNSQKDQLKVKDDEILALKAVNETSDAEAQEKTSVAKADRLSEDDRKFEVEVEVKGKPKKVKALLMDVPKLYLSGEKFSQTSFMENKDAQKLAVEIEHKAIKIFK